MSRVSNGATSNPPLPPPFDVGSRMRHYMLIRRPKMSYKNLVVKEILSLPEQAMGRLYQIVHPLLENYKYSAIASPKRKSLKGIWGNVTITDDDMNEAKSSLFKYDR